MPYLLEIENLSLASPTHLLKSTHMCMDQCPGARALARMQAGTNTGVSESGL